MCTEMHELLADKRISREDKAAARNSVQPQKAWFSLQKKKERNAYEF